MLAAWLLGAAAPLTPPDPGDDARARLARALDAAHAPTAAAPVLPHVTASPADRGLIDQATRHVAADAASRTRAEAAIAAARLRVAAQADATVDRLHQALGFAAPPVEAVARVAAPGAIHHVPLLFVSSSMPLDELRTYAAQIERTGGALAFRGMPGGLHRVAPMAKLSAEILRLDPACEGPACRMRAVPIVVDPIAFRKHGVTAVPALALVPGDPTAPYCERDDIGTGPDILVTGDAALSGLFEEYARLGGGKEVADAQARLGLR